MATFKYKWKPGDNPLSVAKRYNLSPEKLLGANRGGYPFSTGQQIRVPSNPAPYGPAQGPGFRGFGGGALQALPTSAPRPSLAGAAAGQAAYPTNTRYADVNLMNWAGNTLVKIASTPLYGPQPTPQRGLNAQAAARAATSTASAAVAMSGYNAGGAPYSGALPGYQEFGRYRTTAQNLNFITGQLENGIAPEYIPPATLAAMKSAGFDATGYYSENGHYAGGSGGGSKVSGYNAQTGGRWGPGGTGNNSGGAIRNWHGTLINGGGGGDIGVRRKKEKKPASWESASGVVNWNVGSG